VENKTQIARQKLLQTIDLLYKLATKDNFPVYSDLLTTYSNALKIFDANKDALNYDQLGLKFTTRIFQEAPPADKELGLAILHAMDGCYKYFTTKYADL
jgi:hypothetical protein